MSTEQFITYSRQSFALIRWAPLVAAAFLPFTFARGVIPGAFFLGAVIIAVTWLASLVFAWRMRSEILLGFGFVLLLFGSRLLGVHGSEISLSQSIQWLCFVVILAGTPLLFFRRRFLHFARLDAPNVA